MNNAETTHQVPSEVDKLNKLVSGLEKCTKVEDVISLTQGNTIDLFPHTGSVMSLIMVAICTLGGGAITGSPQGALAGAIIAPIAGPGAAFFWGPILGARKQHKEFVVPAMKAICRHLDVIAPLEEGKKWTSQRFVNQCFNYNMFVNQLKSSDHSNCYGFTPLIESATLVATRVTMLAGRLIGETFVVLTGGCRTANACRKGVENLKP